MVLVPVNVKLPTSPLGIPDMSPVDTVMSPELEIFVIDRVYPAMARVTPESTVSVVSPVMAAEAL